MSVLWVIRLFGQFVMMPIGVFFIAFYAGWAASGKNFLQPPIILLLLFGSMAFGLGFLVSMYAWLYNRERS